MVFVSIQFDHVGIYLVITVPYGYSETVIHSDPHKNEPVAVARSSSAALDP